MKAGHTANDGSIVSKTAIAMNLAEVGEQPLDVVEGLWPLWMAGQLGFLPGSLRPFHLFLQRADALMQLCELAARVFILTGGGLDQRHLPLHPLQFLLCFLRRFHDSTEMVRLKWFG